MTCQLPYHLPQDGTQHNCPDMSMDMYRRAASLEGGMYRIFRYYIEYNIILAKQFWWTKVTQCTE